MPKRSLTPFVLLLAGLFCTAQAIEIRPVAEIQFPAKTKVAWENHGKEGDKKIDSDLVFEVGSEFLWYTNYIRYGAGLAYKSPLQKGSTTAAPGAIPVWISTGFGLFNKQAFVQPYAAVRFGTLAPLTSNGNWWESPLNFFVSAGAGAIFPYGIGLEVLYDYSSVKKSFKSDDRMFRVSTGRVGVQLSVGFDLGGAPADNSKNEQNNGELNPVNYETTFQDPYNEPEPATPAESESSSTETPTEPEATPAEVPSEPEASPDTAVTDVPAEATPAAEPEAAPAEPVEETPAEPEAVAEPAPEPEAAPAPVEEPKPEVKKASKPAKKATKKAAKKPAKKATKKPAKKAAKKKK